MGAAAAAPYRRVQREAGAMKLSHIIFSRGAARLRRLGVSMLVALLTIGDIASASADAALPAGAPTAAALTAWAMRWFTEMQAGRTDRSQYAPDFAAEVTDEVVQTISRDLNRYGASPLRAEIVQTRKGDEQTFYEVKFIFPRGDATTLLFGFDAEGKITGVAVQSMAGD
jgi:hypothetical protein